MEHQHEWPVENVSQMQTITAMVVCLKDGCNTIKKHIGRKELALEGSKLEEHRKMAQVRS